MATMTALRWMVRRSQRMRPTADHAERRSSGAAAARRPPPRPPPPPPPGRRRRPAAAAPQPQGNRTPNTPAPASTGATRALVVRASSSTIRFTVRCMAMATNSQVIGPARSWMYGMTLATRRDDQAPRHAVGHAPQAALQVHAITEPEAVPEDPVVVEVRGEVQADGLPHGRIVALGLGQLGVHRVEADERHDSERHDVQQRRGPHRKRLEPMPRERDPLAGAQPGHAAAIRVRGNRLPADALRQQSVTHGLVLPAQALVLGLNVVELVREGVSIGTEHGASIAPRPRPAGRR